MSEVQMDALHSHVRKPVVVLAEDSPLIRRVVATELARAGYAVVAVEDAMGALALSAVGERIDALVTDIDMPGHLDGLDLAQEIRGSRPRLPVVYMSTMRPAAGRMVEGSTFVEKPFAPGAIAREVGARRAAA